MSFILVNGDKVAVCTASREFTKVTRIKMRDAYETEHPDHEIYKKWVKEVASFFNETVAEDGLTVSVSPENRKKGLSHLLVVLLRSPVETVDNRFPQELLDAKGDPLQRLFLSYGAFHDTSDYSWGVQRPNKPHPYSNTIHGFQQTAWKWMPRKKVLPTQLSLVKAIEDFKNLNSEVTFDYAWLTGNCIGLVS